MEIYKKASKQKLRVQTKAGLLSVEQLWDLPVSQLDEIAVDLEKQYKSSGKKSFLDVDSKKDKLVKLKFDIVLDILQTKVEDNNKARKAAETKAKREKLLDLIAQKEEGELLDKSKRELEKELEKLDE